MNNTDSVASLTKEVTISTITVLIVATVFGTVGNVVLLLVIFTNKHVRTLETVFVTNLAISDLYVTALADPFAIIAKLYGEAFFDKIPGLCQTIASMCTISCVSSLMTIALMSVNRYVYICRNEKYRVIFTYRNVILMCMSVYTVGTFLVLLNQAGIGDHSFDHKSFECIWDRMATFPYTVVFSVTLVWIPTLVTGACYLRIYLYVSAHRRKITQQNSGKEIDKQHPVSHPRQIHLATTLFTIYAVFTTCWIPYALLIVVDTKDEFPHEVHVYITMWAHLHPSVNWIIYYLTNKKFADAYKHMFRRCFAAWFPETNQTNQTTRINNGSAKAVTDSTLHSRRDELKLEDIDEAEIASCSRLGHKTSTEV